LQSQFTDTTLSGAGVATAAIGLLAGDTLLLFRPSTT